MQRSLPVVIDVNGTLALNGNGQQAASAAPLPRPSLGLEPPSPAARNGRRAPSSAGRTSESPAGTRAPVASLKTDKANLATAEREAAIRRANDLTVERDVAVGRANELEKAQREEFERAGKDLGEQRDALLNALTSANRENKILKKTLDETKAQVVSLEREKGELAAELEATTAECDVAIRRADELESVNSGMERELASLRKEKDELEKAFECPKQEKEAAEGSEEDDLASSREVQGGGAVCYYATRIKKQGRRQRSERYRRGYSRRGLVGGCRVR